MSSSASPEWIVDIQRYCKELNIEFRDLYEIVTDLKVAPMIRGKAFEFSMLRRLREVLPKESWIVEKPKMNAQSSTHDVDVQVRHITSEITVTVECKLAGKGNFKKLRKDMYGASKGDYAIGVKCMRSRTTKSPDKVTVEAMKANVSYKQFLNHSDQYRESNFDIVATSIGNAFYKTVEDEDGNPNYKFQPGVEGIKFIELMKPPSIRVIEKLVEAAKEAARKKRIISAAKRKAKKENREFDPDEVAETSVADEEIVFPEEVAELQQFVYNKIYVAASSSLAVSDRSGVVCGKEGCTDKKNCGFIPNYPLINFGDLKSIPEGQSIYPINKWVELKDCVPIFEAIVEQKQN